MRGGPKTLAFVERTRAVPELMTAARRLIFSKGRDSHDYKFSSAALEDYYNVTRRLGDRLPAAEHVQPARHRRPRQRPDRADEGGSRKSLACVVFRGIRKRMGARDSFPAWPLRTFVSVPP